MTRDIPVGEVHLESGDVVDVTVRTETYGSPTAGHTILVCHALTGSAHVMSENGDPPGWWEIVSGPGALLDPSRSFIVAQNVIGGSDGTTGPAFADRSGRRFGERFPKVTVRDMVAVEQRALAEMGIEHIDVAIGGSLGGMQALEWAFSLPDAVDLAVAIGAHLWSRPSVMAYNAVQRAAIALDPRLGLEVARMVGMITYRSPGEFDARFGRERQGGMYAVESYLRHHGRTLAGRFDPVSYVRLATAMDDHDVFRGRTELPARRPHIHMVGIEPDVLFPASETREDVRRLEELKWPVSYGELRTDVGHDAFLVDGPGLTEAVGDLLPARR